MVCPKYCLFLFRNNPFQHRHVAQPVIIDGANTGELKCGSIIGERFRSTRLAVQKDATKAWNDHDRRMSRPQSIQE
jgi:hypothetical protein